MRRIRRLIYGFGFRPKPGSVFYSPSMAFVALMQDNRVIDKFREEIGGQRQGSPGTDSGDAASSEGNRDPGNGNQAGGD